jgi:hypothetical protein
MRRPPLTRAKVIATLALFCALTGFLAVTAASADVRPLPTMLMGPLPLEPGTYQTRPAFVPRTTFTVGQGWYGGQGSHTDWCVGKGLNRSEGRFGAAGICGMRLSLPYATAVSRFKALTTLTAGPPKPIRVGGYPGVSFHAVVQGDSATTPGFRRIFGGVRRGGEQIFLNVRGTTLLLRIDIFTHKAGEAAVRGFLRTVRFPR